MPCDHLIYEQRCERTCFFAYVNTKMQVSCTVTTRDVKSCQIRHPEVWIRYPDTSGPDVRIRQTNFYQVRVTELGLCLSLGSYTEMKHPANWKHFIYMHITLYRYYHGHIMLTRVYHQRHHIISFENCHFYSQKIRSILHTCRSVQILDFRLLSAE